MHGRQVKLAHQAEIYVGLPYRPFGRHLFHICAVDQRSERTMLNNSKFQVCPVDQLFHLG